MERKKFHPLYIWGIICLLLTYAYPVLWYVTLPKVDDTVTSDAAYEALAREQNGALGSDLPMVFFAVPFVLLVINIVISIVMKNTDRKVFLNVSRLIKYWMIPFYLAGGVIIVFFLLMMFTPIVIMVFVSPVVVVVLSALGWISMVGTAPFMIAYLKRARKDGQYKRFFTFVIGVMQFFFGLDVIGTIICAGRENCAKRDTSAKRDGSN